MVSLVIKVRAKIYSFQAKIKVKIPVVTNAGIVRGKMICHNMGIVLYPSTLAASSNSFGNCWKKLLMTKMVRGKLIAV